VLNFTEEVIIEEVEAIVDKKPTKPWQDCLDHNTYDL